ncbi:anther-specific proline-rich protein APG-like [Miscanthus floridulus]|uniref:anther-specific proline-rich protein APG-like n=1 Tax=Miscanthus floridulus TaxID=154761 RepID=UPI0034593A4A
MSGGGSAPPWPALLAQYEVAGATAPPTPAPGSSSLRLPCDTSLPSARKSLKRRNHPAPPPPTVRATRWSSPFTCPHHCRDISSPPIPSRPCDPIAPRSLAGLAPPPSPSPSSLAAASLAKPPATQSTRASTVLDVVPPAASPPTPRMDPDEAAPPVSRPSTVALG